MKKFLEAGAYLYPQEAGPFTQAEWAELQDCVSLERKEAYDAYRMKDPDLHVKLKVYRLKEKGVDQYKDDRVRLLFFQKLLPFLKKETALKKPFIDRVQSHFYEVGDGKDLHSDIKLHPFYRYAVLLFMNEGDSYKGGEFNVHHPKLGVCGFKGPQYSLLITPSCYPHEVIPVRSGYRHTVALFIMEEADKNKPFDFVSYQGCFIKRKDLIT